MLRDPENRPVKVANCSGYHGDPAYEMYRQATLGDVDFITGDYLAEVNLANNAEAWRAGKHPGYEETAWQGLQQTIDVVAEKGIRVVINGGALDPRALALKVEALTAEKKLDICVAYVSGDDLYPQVGPNMPTNKDELQHLDSGNSSIVPSRLTYAFMNTTDGSPIPMTSAHAYLGARGIVEGLRRGAQIIICGRVADASPVIAAAWFWYDWSETDYDRLAGALITGHLIECSAYVTGANFAGFDKYPVEDLIAPGFPIAEIERDGTCVITKHPGTQGVVNTDTVKCQFLYELQGNVYLNSDVSAHIGDVIVEDAGKDRYWLTTPRFTQALTIDRVRVSGIRGSPPPPTTKLAVFYPGGYEAQLLYNATGYATARKWDLLEKQLRHFLPESAANDLETLEFQRIGVPDPNPSSQLKSTTYMRIFIAARTAQAVTTVAKAMRHISLKHFSGFHASPDARTAVPRPFLAYYPAIINQSDINEKINILNGQSKTASFDIPRPSQYEPLKPRESYDPVTPTIYNGPTKDIRLGDIALARSGDKGANLNFGIFVSNPAHWEWLRSSMTISRMRDLLGDDWDDSFSIERVEFPQIHAVHFVIYGILGRGVSSSSRLDGYGKGFADYIRDKVVSVPVQFDLNLSTKL
ncbi:hypothetical protein BDV32DRAFT_139489 [Aspergillus pseudonomiae]|uniref:Uncharacterized protein n=1 Tax=Aspergillus pseudonomiae TaxID=1506151 RepID=A0A5N7D996_9EURO|nr:uncharacterized protein BDV37DRAFT_295366 [Aspergillus pseudonomiae]KAB8258588.1 hypothetical protein BDV32DRAFT_139489 [Aspergillus pseudonomiae]KAE8402533.1 hypothetical protein BDV37DRAFT_295366 [Aspergillus pseudonomiae]